MQDGIIKGTGNSRLLKAPTTIPATWEAFRAALIAGTLPIDLLFNAAGWDVQGTPLNKANLLTDAVAEALGLTSDDPTVNEAINALIALIAAEVDERQTEIIPIARGGTGKTTATTALAALGIGYGTCTTAAATTAKVVTLSGFSLTVGGIIAVKFTNANTVASATLNVNGTGAKGIYVNGSAISASSQIVAGMLALFQYDGTYWQLLNPAYPPGIVPIANGGTGASSVSAAIANLGLVSASYYGKRAQMSVGTGHVASDGAGLITYANEDYDDFSAIAGTNQTRITIPASLNGRYVKFYWQGYGKSGQDGRSASVILRKNGVDVDTLYSVGPSNVSLNNAVFGLFYSKPILVATSDYFETYAEVSNISGNQSSIAAGSVFGMEVF